MAFTQKALLNRVPVAASWSDMRCQHLVISVAAEHISRLVVGHDHQDVGAINHGTSESLNNFQ